MYHLGCVPFYVIAEKRFALAAKIVQTFLDPLYNDNIFTGLTWDRETCVQIANSLTDVLSDETIAAFNNAHRFAKASDMKTALDLVITDLNPVRPELVECFEGCRKHLAEIAAVEAASIVDQKGINAINLPCLTGFLVLVERFSRKAGVKVHQVLHDEQKVYEHLFRRHADVMAKMKKISFTYFDGTPLDMSLEQIKSFDMGNSKNEPLIQAADILAGTIREVYLRIYRGEILGGDFRDLGDMVIPPLFDDNFGFVNPIWSASFFMRLGECYLPEGAITKSSDVNLSMTFPMAIVKNDGEQSTYKLTFPVYATVDYLRLLEVGCRQGDIDDEAVVHIYSNRRDAEEKNREICLALQDVSCEVIEFDVNNLDEYLRFLRQANNFVSKVCFDWIYCADLARLINGIEAMWNRVKRLSASGLMGIIMKEHSTVHGMVRSFLLSSGEYAAYLNMDTFVTAGTREEAVQNLVRSIAR